MDGPVASTLHIICIKRTYGQNIVCKEDVRYVYALLHWGMHSLTGLDSIARSHESIYLPHGIVSFMYCAQDSCIYYIYLFLHIHNL
jgi:hypothetical protein